MNRRDFIKLLGVGAAALVLPKPKAQETARIVDEGITRSVILPSGEILDFTVWDRELSAEEIALDYDRMYLASHGLAKIQYYHDIDPNKSVDDYLDEFDERLL